MEIKESKIHGKGVFATSKIYKGDKFIVDVLPFNKKEIPKGLENHIFPYNGEMCCICIGFVTYINHSQTPNIKILSLDKVKNKKTFIVLNDIEIGEELTLYYNDKFNKKINE